MNEDLIDMLEEAISLLESHQWIRGESYQFHGDGLTRPFIRCPACYAIEWGSYELDPAIPTHRDHCKIKRITDRLGGNRLRTHLLLM